MDARPKFGSRNQAVKPCRRVLRDVLDSYVLVNVHGSKGGYQTYFTKVLGFKYR